MDSSAAALALDNAGRLSVVEDFMFAGDELSPLIAQANVTPQPMVIEGIRVDAGAVTLDCRGAAAVMCAVHRATDVRFTENLSTLKATDFKPHAANHWSVAETRANLAAC